MMMIDVEKLKWIKKEVRKVEKRINKFGCHDEDVDLLLHVLNIWDRVRKHCYFLKNDKLSCNYSLKHLKLCDPLYCPLGKDHVVVVKDSIVVID